MFFNIFQKIAQIFDNAARGFHDRPPEIETKRKRPKLYERKAYTYIKNGKEISVKATTGGGKG